MISNEDSRIQYSGNGSTVTFSFPYSVYDSAHLIVVLTDTDDDTDTTQVEDTDYTVTVASDYESASVTFSTAPTSTDRVTIYRETPREQTVDYVESDRFPASAHETALDKLTLQMQEIDEKIGRAFLMPVTGDLDSISFTMQNAVAGQAYRWNASGTGLELYTPLTSTTLVDSSYFADDGGTPSVTPTASGDGSIAIGDGAGASAQNAFSLGSGSSASAVNTVAIGGGAEASASYDIAIGGVASGSNSTAIGKSSAASGNSSCAIGFSSNATNTRSVAIANADATGTYSIAIGNAVTATANHTTAMGNSSNATGAYSTALGETCVASGVRSLAAGDNVTVSGDSSFALGKDVTVSHDKSVALGSSAISDFEGGLFFNGGGEIASAGDTQVSIAVLSGSTTNATQTEIFCARTTNSRINIPSDCTIGFTAQITARRSDADNESAYYEISGCIDNNAGTTALVSTISANITKEDTAAWAVTFEADDTNDALVCKVTGEASKTIQWCACVRMVKVKA